MDNNEKDSSLFVLSTLDKDKTAESEYDSHGPLVKNNTVNNDNTVIDNIFYLFIFEVLMSAKNGFLLVLILRLKYIVHKSKSTVAYAF
jgi:hypothetical protein